MKKYLIAKMKTGSMRQFNSLKDLKEDIDNVYWGLSIKANTLHEAVQKFIPLEQKYDKINKSDKLKHIIDLDN